jgi:hypothetical protein
MQSDGAGFGGFSVELSVEQGLYLTVSDAIVDLATTLSAETWQFCTLTRSADRGNVIEFYIGDKGANAPTNPYNGTSTTDILGNSTSLVEIGSNSAAGSKLSNVLLKDIRWVTGYSDPSVNMMPTGPLTSISGTQLLFTMSEASAVWVDSVYDTDMTLGLNVQWTGFNPFQTMNLSWGAMIPRAPYTYYGSGFPPPSTQVSSAMAGDIYIDIATSIGYIRNDVSFS